MSSPAEAAPSLDRSRDGSRSTRLSAAGLVVGSALSTQLGAAYAVQLFDHTSPTMAAWLRNTVGAIVLLLLVAVRRGRLSGINLRVAVLLGVILGTMNATFYEAISRLPLGDAVCIEFVGPIAVAAFGSRSRRDLVWVALAAAGVVAVSHPGPDHLNYVGILFVLAAAVCWMGWILVGRQVATAERRGATLAVAMLVSSVWLVLPALLRSASSLGDLHVLWFGLVVGILSSALPYSIDMVAMSRVSSAVFGVLLSLQPAAAALMGFLVLGQRVSLLDLVGFALVIVASAGVTLNVPAAQGTIVEAPMGAS